MKIGVIIKEARELCHLNNTRPKPQMIFDRGKKRQRQNFQEELRTVVEFYFAILYFEFSYCLKARQ